MRIENKKVKETQNTESSGVINSENSVTVVYGKDNYVKGDNSVIFAYGKGYTDINELQEDHSRIQESPLALLDVLKKNRKMEIENRKGKWFVNGNDYGNMTPAEREVLNAYFKGLKIEKSCF